VNTLNSLVARERNRDLQRAAEQGRPDPRNTPVSRVTLRYASAADTDRLRELAKLDRAAAPAGPALVAEIDGRLRAALPLDGGSPIADRLHRGAELLELLRLRAAQLARY
jgi:hypothetical protein